MNSQELQLHYEEIKNMYLEQNLSPKEIGVKFGVERYKINYILEKNGIQKTYSEVRRKYKINENYFDEINTPNKAYILGFLYADGYNNRVNNTIVLSLSQKDEDILTQIRDEIGSDKPLYYIDYVNKYDGVERHMVNMTLASSHMCDMLEKWGMHQNKTFNINFPEFLDDELYSHFIRGYFDGDGCACIVKDNRNNKIRYRLQVTMMSSLLLCKGMEEHLLQEGIIFHTNHPTGKSELNGLIRSGSNIQTKKFMEYIYKDADLYMDRKYQVFKEYFNNKD